MFCRNCGTEIKEGAAFCPNCGTAVNKPVTAEENVQENVPEVKDVVEVPVEETAVVTEEPANVASASESASNPFSSDGESEMMSKMASALSGAAGSAANKMKGNKRLLGIVASAAVVLVLVLLIVLLQKPTINMDKYVEVEFEGYDGVGNARVTLDWDKIEKDYGKKLKVKKLSKEDKKVLGLLGADEDEIAFMCFQGCISYSVDQRSELSNGDKVTLQWDIDEDEIEEYLNVKVKATEKEYTVKELEEVDLFDPFEYVTLEYSGTSPNGRVSLKKDSTSEMMSYLDFSISKNSELANGDKVIVTANIYMGESEFAKKFGCLPSAKEKEYEVDGLPGYITASSEIPEDTMAKMKKQTEDIIVASSGNWDSDKQKLTGTEYVGNYFITPKGSSGGYYNRIYLVYKVNATAIKEIKGTVSSQDVSYYYAVAFNNLMTVPQDGSVFVDLTQYDKIYNSISKKLEFIGPSGAVSGTYYFNGYETIDEIYNVAVIRNIENYNYEENITK